MKEQKKIAKLDIKNTFGLTLTIDESLDKYNDPKYRAPKLDRIEKKFGQQSELKFKKETVQH
jgi:hypothetical protein